MSAFVATGIRPALPCIRQRPASGPWLRFIGRPRTVFVHHGVLVAVRTWAGLGDPNERLGLLAGRGCEDAEGAYTLVVGAVLASGAVSNRAHVSADVGVMQCARQLLLERYPVAEVAGWWHTHPGYGTQFSGTDRETQATYRNDHLVGLVVDPRIAGPAGFGLYVGPNADRLAAAEDPTLPFAAAAAYLRPTGAS